MQTIANHIFAVSIADDGTSVTVRDIARDIKWLLDTENWGYLDPSCPDEQKVDFAKQPECALTPFGAGKVSRISDTVIEVECPVPGGKATYTWVLMENMLEVSLNVDSGAVQRVSSPGSFKSESGDQQVLFSAAQGVLARNIGPNYRLRRFVGLWSPIPMYAYMAGNGALQVISDDTRDMHLLHGKDDQGLFCTFECRPCAVHGWYERKVKILPGEADINALAKQYRQYLIDRGEFVSWDEKIARKPIVEKLFGSLVAFIGYNQGRNTDYVKSAEKLKNYGFENVMYYPVRLNAISNACLMGGDPFLHLSDEEIGELKMLGGMVSPWSWITEAIDDGTDKTREVFRHDKDGKRLAFWQIDDAVMEQTCLPYAVDFVKKQYDGPMSCMDWVHYDVVANVGGQPCFCNEHEKHCCTPMSARDDQENIGNLLDADVNGNRIVSSEGFNTFSTRHYDIGSNKYVPAWGDAACIPVPLSLLIFHDSTVHNWWELHTYNSVPKFDITHDGAGAWGSGLAEKKSAMDALYGCPPLVFPFGRQYAWEDYEARKTCAFEVSIDDEEVRKALEVALPVAKLHEKIGKCEMLSFEFVSDDFAVQTTLFSDGTRIVANISDEDKDTEQYGRISANTWLEVQV